MLHDVILRTVERFLYMTELENDGVLDVHVERSTVPSQPTGTLTIGEVDVEPVETTEYGVTEATHVHPFAIGVAFTKSVVVSTFPKLTSVQLLLSTVLADWVGNIAVRACVGVFHRFGVDNAPLTRKLSAVHGFAR